MGPKHLWWAVCTTCPTAGYTTDEWWWMDFVETYRTWATRICVPLLWFDLKRICRAEGLQLWIRCIKFVVHFFTGLCDSFTNGRSFPVRSPDNLLRILNCNILTASMIISWGDILKPNMIHDLFVFFLFWTKLDQNSYDDQGWKLAANY